MVNCRCGASPEVRKVEDGFVVGCWNESHRYVLIGNEGSNYGFDLWPETGLTKATEIEAIQSWEMWAEVFRETDSQNIYDLEEVG